MTIYDQIMNEKADFRESFYRLIRYRLYYKFKLIFEEYPTDRVVSIEDSIHQFYIYIAGENGTFDILFRIRDKDRFLGFLFSTFRRFLIWKYTKPYLNEQRLTDSLKGLSIDDDKEDLSELKESEIAVFADKFARMDQCLDPSRSIQLTLSMLQTVKGRTLKQYTVADKMAIGRNKFRSQELYVKRSFLKAVLIPDSFPVELDPYHQSMKDNIINRSI